MAARKDPKPRIGSDPLAQVEAAQGGGERVRESQPPLRGRDKASKPSKATFYLPPDLLAELRGASANLPPIVIGGTLSALVQRALEHELEALRRKYNKSKPFSASGSGRRGRPPKQ